MKMVVLAAGRGTRALVTAAKCSVEVMGATLLELVIGTGIRCGIEDFLVIRSHPELPQIPGIRYHFCADQRNMVHSLFSADSELIAPLIVSYADIVYEPRVLQTLLDTPGDVCVTVDSGFADYFARREPNPETITESLRIEHDAIVSIGRAVTSVSEAEAQYVGLLKFTNAGLAWLRDTYNEVVSDYGNRPWRTAKDASHAPMTDLLQELIDRGHRVTPSLIRNGWIEIDTPGDLAVARSIERGDDQWILRRETLAGRPVVSAGGFPVRRRDGLTEVLLVGSGAPGEWRIPKGMVKLNETVEQAAVREVAEETGVVCALGQHIGYASWSYTYQNAPFEELVSFYLLTPLGLSVPRDDEHAQIAWITLGALDAALKYESERAVARRLLAVLTWQ
jgi:choline kinase/8-oxo-dGTP pyrophosphatase MutT (NUDIX family)